MISAAMNFMGAVGKLIFGELRLAFGQVGADKLKELLHAVAAQG